MGLIAPNTVLTFRVEEGDAGARLDKYIAEQVEHYSRSFFQHGEDSRDAPC